MSGVVLDYGNMLAPRLGGRGLDPDALDGELAERFAAARDTLEARREAGDLGFLDLPYATDLHAGVREAADGFAQWFENLVILGIGGSGLGTTMLRDALLGHGWNRRSDDERDFFPRLFVLDNPDPASVHELLSGLDLRKTLFNVVSKSGSTAETMALYLVVRGRLAEHVDGDKIRGHFLFTTDAERGGLRRIADAEGIPTLPVPPNVGGRFSVLSPVGLFPAAVCGVDTAALLEGAARMEKRCRDASLGANPAGVLALLLHAADVELGASVHVLMPYADRLRSLALWFQQLWAESLGKERSESGEVVESGPTPLPALGATDQHSQLQLFMEGPRDKVVVFLAVEEWAADVAIPALHDDIEALAYLGGHSLGELLAVERRATAEALRRRGRPSMTIEVDRISPSTIGELVMLFEAATVLAGALYGVDPLGQPGVELGKQLTYGLLGRPGHTPPEAGHADPRWRV